MKKTIVFIITYIISTALAAWDNIANAGASASLLGWMCGGAFICAILYPFVNAFIDDSPNKNNCDLELPSL
ncbi:hypothetical protein [Campylobacter geochelonis]|uniref:hypothetical protein n=1 Tax=Campylobacter geochelonis TaxID=1780362 RepID=UPI0007707FCD|nr:hypothetical protein [Campylobacter geochelonis]CZE50016.1 Uncharacterised protein [Campylobacter geochelonis]